MCFEQSQGDYLSEVVNNDELGIELAVTHLAELGHRNIAFFGGPEDTSTGRKMPEDGIEQLREFDAIYLGAAGFPTVPDHISLWGLLIPIRREFD